MRSVSASFNLATMSLLCCCLCLQTLPTDRRKRKKLNGTGCTRAREVLTSMSTSSHECLEIMLQNGDAALCINCDSVLINISKYEQKLESLKKDMMEKVSIVMDQGLHSSSTLSAGKRPASKEVMPQTKNARIGSTPSSSAQPSPVLTVASTIPTSQEPGPSRSPTDGQQSPHIEVKITFVGTVMIESLCNINDCLCLLS